ncbi:condensation domain-containing protein, partial [Microbulbifer sp. 2304DJ12-6]|uniref:condensation domain-containing protein n=1 Tax=Microbulbifer sp. 2304DJ12-6 TaxID=3233340 RepID=UPI0039AF84CD
FFVNTLVLRLDVDPKASLAEYLKAVKAIHLGAQEHQDIPFELLVEQLNPERSQQHTPLFQVMMNFLQITEQAQDSDKAGGLSFEPLGGAGSVAKFELTLTASEFVDGLHSRLRLGLNYATALFDHSTMTAMLDRLVRLFEGLAQSTGSSIPATLPLLSDTEFESATRMAEVVQVGDTLLSQFDKAVATRAQQTAVSMVTHGVLVSINFGELNRKGNQLANLLVNGGICSGDRVGLMSSRSIDLRLAMTPMSSSAETAGLSTGVTGCP